MLLVDRKTQQGNPKTLYTQQHRRWISEDSFHCIKTSGYTVMKQQLASELTCASSDQEVSRLKLHDALMRATKSPGLWLRCDLALTECVGSTRERWRVQISRKIVRRPPDVSTSDTKRLSWRCGLWLYTQPSSLFTSACAALIRKENWFSYLFRNFMNAFSWDALS